MINNHILDNAVYIYKLEINCTPSSEDIARSAYEFLKALSPSLKKRQALEKLEDFAPRVVIKPNVTVPAERNSGIITHPDFVSGMVDYFLDVGMSCEGIIVAEGGGTEESMEKHFSQSGYEEMAQRQNVRLVNLNFDESVLVHLPQAEILKDIGIARMVKDKNYFINVPKLKTHNLAVTTLCMKNLMGTIVPARARHLCSIGSEYASRANEITPNGIMLREELLCRKLCDLSLASKPDLNIIEGITGRDGTAFHHGKNIQTNLVIGGKNVVSVDAVASYLMGFDPMGIGYLKIADQRGLGVIDVTKIKVFEVSNGRIALCDNINKFMSPIPFEVLAGDKQARGIPLNKEMLARCQHIAV